MRIPKIKQIAQSARSMDTFRGYNHALRIGDGEWYDEMNITSDEYPIFSTRKKRKLFKKTSKYIHGMVLLNGLWYVSGEKIYKYVDGINDIEVNLGLEIGKKRLTTFGSYIIVMPDKKYVNTAKQNALGVFDDFGEIEKKVSRDGVQKIMYTICTENFVEVPSGARIAQAEEPTDEQYIWWLKTDEVKPTLYNKNGGKWEEVKHYVRVAGYPWASWSGTYSGKFEKGESVWIDSQGFESNDALRLIKNKSVKVEKAEYSFVYIDAPVLDFDVQTSAIQGTSVFSISTKIPNMDFMFEHDNRLWGCRYGIALNGEFVNEIYASALGDFKSWEKFSGTSTDSYAMSCGSNGEFTGAAEVGGYPVFFKERFLYKVYGDYPAQYSADAVECYGVKRGCADSMAVINGVLFYRGVNAIYRYDGTMPFAMSDSFGNGEIPSGVGGAANGKYYICGEDALYVWDTNTRCWHKEGGINAMTFCNNSESLIYCVYNQRDVLSIGGSGENVEGDLHWYAISGILGVESLGNKRLQRIDLRFSVNVGTRIHVYVEYNSSGYFENVATLVGRNIRSFAIPIRPKRCDHLRIKLEGDGEARLFGITYITEKGSDMR